MLVECIKQVDSSAFVTKSFKNASVLRYNFTRTKLQHLVIIKLITYSFKNNNWPRLTNMTPGDHQSFMMKTGKQLGPCQFSQLLCVLVG